MVANRGRVRKREREGQRQKAHYENKHSRLSTRQISETKMTTTTAVPATTATNAHTNTRKKALNIEFLADFTHIRRSLRREKVRGGERVISMHEARS